MSQESKTDSKEARVLHAMKRTLTGVIRDTTTPPGHRHPLSDETIEDIRQCLMLISAREREIAADAGQSSDARPYFADGTEARTARQGGRGCGFTDEPKKSVAVPLAEITKPKKRGPESV
jgi:hypothetical protein